MAFETAPFAIGTFRFHPSSNTMEGPAGQLTLEPKVMAVLVQLATRRGEVVTRAELIDRVWGHEFGADESLTRAISRIRKALGDGRTGTRFIETIPKRGYRLLDEPNELGLAPAIKESMTNPAARGARGLLRWLAVAMVLAALYFGWLAVERQTGPGPGSPADLLGQPVLAVLPFDYQGADEIDAHLADGLADEVLSMLSRSADLAVIAGTSSFRFRDDRKDLDLLRRELSISHLVDGTVRRASDGLRVSVHLVDATSGLVLWSEVIERGEESFYSIPDEVGSAILRTLEADPVVASHEGRAPDPGAYESYLHARALMRDGTPDNLDRAIQLLQNAVRIDPEFAEASAQLAVALLNILVTRPVTEEHIDPAARRRTARQAAERALALDSDSIDARLALAILDYRERAISLAEGEVRFRDLVQRAPNHPNVNMRMGMMLVELGHIEEAYGYHRRSFDLDRFSGLIMGFYSAILFRSGRWDDAHALIEEVNRLWAMSFLPLTQYATYLAQGRYAAARDWIHAVRRAHHSGAMMHVPAPGILPTLANIVDSLETGKRVPDETVRALENAMRSGLETPYNVLQVYGALERHDEALALMLERLRTGDRWFRSAPFSATLGPLRRDPRIMTVFATSGQLEYWMETGHWPDFCRAPDLPYDCRAVGERALARLERE